MAKLTSYEARTRRHRACRRHVVGTPERPRLNVFRSLAHIYAQVIDDQAGNTLVSASTIDEELRPQMDGKKKSEQAKLVGQAVADRAKAKGMTWWSSIAAAIATLARQGPGRWRPRRRIGVLIMAMTRG